MTLDPIVALESLGYTRREAAFLYLVAVHSGYFLRRQFDYFIDRNKGSIVMRFLEKARIAGHIRLLDPAPGRQVYHLFYKPVYRLIGAPDSQNRRIKGDGDVRTRLVKLDYVLENDQDHYLESEADKLHYLTTIRGIDPQILLSENECLLPDLQSLLVGVADPANPAQSLVRFVMADEGLTITRFERVLERFQELLRVLGTFEFIYVASSDHNFRPAEALFRRLFSFPLRSLEPSLDSSWFRTHQNPLLARPTLHAQFTTVLLGFNYPPWQRNEARGSHQRSELMR